jgi:Family of unknown function (DUF6325)
MAYGPVEFLVLRFPGNQFTGEIVPALKELTDTGTVRIIDLLFAMKDADGNISMVEIDGLADTVQAELDPLAQTEDELLAEADALAIGEMLEPNSSAALLLFENTWAARFATAVSNANGELLLNERIPRIVIDEVLAEIHS